MFTSFNPDVIGITVPFTEALELASTYGFEGVDLPIVELSELSLPEIKVRFEEKGLRVGGWGLPVDFRRGEESYQAGLAKLASHARIAQELGGTRCFTWILPFSEALDYHANMELHVKRLRPIAQILADHGCRLGLEFVGPLTMRQGHRYAFISTLPEAVELGNRLGTGNVGLQLDCWHWYTSHGTIDDLKHLTTDQVVYVHVNDAPVERALDEQIDNQRLLPGASGVIDIAGFLQALKRITYDGPVVVEPFNAELNALPYAERIRATRASLTRIWQIAKLR